MATLSFLTNRSEKKLSNENQLAEESDQIRKEKGRKKERERREKGGFLQGLDRKILLLDP